MNMDQVGWVVGIDYQDASTCATCHISATPNQPATHDVGDRISWTLRPVVSKKLANWEERRERMKDVCRQCHGDPMIEGFYLQFDNLVVGDIAWRTDDQVKIQNLRGKVSDLDALLDVDGRVKLLPERGYEVDLRVLPADAERERFDRMLRLVPKDEDGRYQLSLSGSL